MTPQEKKQFAELDDHLVGKFQITCLRSEHEQSRPIEEFCDFLGRQVPKISVKKETAESDEMPAILIQDRLFYQAVPSGTEIGPFIDALEMTASESAQIDKRISKQLANIDLPTHMVLYVAAQCTYCPQAVRQLVPLVQANQNIRLTIIDAMLFQDMAQKENVQSVPTLILEGQFRWTGTLELNEVLMFMAERDLSALGPLSLEAMLKEGKAGQLADMMIEKSQIFPAFYALLTHPKWPARLGAMVVMDELIDRNPVLALETIEPLWEQFYKVDDRVKGDLLYIIGEMPQKDFAPQMEMILKGEFNEEVKEAAEEALAKINDRIANS
jgi:hypothetical protein